MSHTPTPWRADEENDGTHCIFAETAHIPVAFTASASNEGANAALIVQAVNAHAALVEACRQAYSLIGPQHAGEGLRVSEALAAALALVEA